MCNAVMCHSLFQIHVRHPEYSDDIDKDISSLHGKQLFHVLEIIYLHHFSENVHTGLIQNCISIFLIHVEGAKYS